MTRALTYTLAAISIMAMGSCETAYDFNFDAPPRLTIVSHLAPDTWEGQKVYVYASQSPLDSGNFYIPENLVVNVTEEESSTTLELVTAIEDDKTFYVFPEGFLKAGNTYSIYAFAPGFDIVQARTRIPKPSGISNLSIEDLAIQQSPAHEFKKIIHYKVEFNIDHFESNQYYHLVFYNEYVGIEDLLIVNPEPSDAQPFIPHYVYGVLVDRSELTDDQTLSFEFKDWVVSGNELKRVYVELRTITEDYYKYHTTLARQLILRQDPFAEPVTIFNNIEGGYGNFSGFSPNISSSDLPR